MAWHGESRRVRRVASLCRLWLSFTLACPPGKFAVKTDSATSRAVSGARVCWFLRGRCAACRRAIQTAVCWFFAEPARVDRSVISGCAFQMSTNAFNLINDMSGHSKRHVGNQMLLHDAVHLLPYMRQPVPRGRASSRRKRQQPSVELSALSTPTSSQGVRRLVSDASSSDLLQRGDLRLPAPAPIAATWYAHDSMLRSEEFAAVGRPLLSEYLAEDNALDRRRRHWDAYAGNAVHVLPRGLADNPQVLHAQGDHMDTVVLRAIGASSSPCAAEASPLAACALPDHHRVLQLAVSPQSSDLNGGRRLLAVRSTHWIHHLMLDHDAEPAGHRRGEASGTGSSIAPGGGPRACCSERAVGSSHEVGSAACSSLRHLAATSLARRPLDAAMNPSLISESACLLDDGRLQLLRLERNHSIVAESAPASAPASMAQTPLRSHGVCIATPPHAIALTSGQHCRVFGNKAQQLASSNGEDATWGALAYAEHPRCLYMATGSGLHLTDLRDRTPQPKLLFDVRALPMPELRAGSMAVSRSARLGATSGAASAAAPLVAIASSEQLLLLDARMGRHPLQQWRLPLPLPFRRHPVAAARSAKPPLPLPHYFVDFGSDHRVLHLVERTTAHPLVVACETAVARRDPACRGVLRDGDWRDLHAAHNASAFHEAPYSLDPDMLLSQRAKVSEALVEGCALPLSGAAIVPFTPPSRASSSNGSMGRRGGSRIALNVLTLGPGGAVDLLYESGYHEDRSDGDRAPGPGTHPVEPAHHGLAKRDRQHDTILDEFCTVARNDVAKVAEKINAAAGPSAPACGSGSPGSLVHGLRDSASWASTETTPEEEGGAGLTVMGTLTQQWKQWTGRQAAASAATPAALAKPPRIGASASAGVGVLGGKRRESSMMPPPPRAARVSFGDALRPGTSSVQGTANPFQIGGRRSVGFEDSRARVPAAAARRVEVDAPREPIEGSNADTEAIPPPPDEPPPPEAPASQDDAMMPSQSSQPSQPSQSAFQLGTGRRSASGPGSKRPRRSSGF